MSKRIDVTVTGDGPMTTVYLFELHTPRARAWVEENVSKDRTMLGKNLAVEHRYAGVIARLMADDGLVLE